MNNLVLEKNLKAWESRYPNSLADIRSKFDAYKNDKDSLIQIESGISYDGCTILNVKKNQEKYYLGGKRNCKELVNIWVETLKDIQPCTQMYMIGLGNVEYLKLLDEKIDEQIQIIIYEPCKEIFFYILENIDISRVLESERAIVFFIEGINERVIEFSLSRLIQAENFEFIKIFILPNYEKLFIEKTAEFVTKIKKQCKKERVRINTTARFANVHAQNIICNVKYVINGYKTKQFVDVIPKDIPAIVVAAGPSLNKNILELKRAKNHAFIIAVDTAIKPLLKAGIVPDMYAVVDGKKPLHLVEIEGAERIPLLTSISAAHALLEYHKGMKIFYNEGYPIVNKMFAMNGDTFEPIPCGGSVATNAFAFAYMIGIKTIILVGQDLALTGNRTHADGTFEEKASEIDTSHAIMVEGNVEEMVPTRKDFQVYLEWYNYYIKGCMESGRELHVINATEGGAKIDNTEIMTLKEAIDRECTKEINVSERIAEVPTVFNENEQNHLKNYLSDISQEFHDIKIAAQNLEKTYRKLQKLSMNGNIDLKAYKKILCKIEKMSKHIERHQECYDLISDSLKIADYILKSEQNIKLQSFEEEGKEIARQGLLYTKLLRECAELFEEFSKENILDEKDKSHRK